MRPRPDAAENRHLAAGDDLEGSVVDASMRPRPDAAENRPPTAVQLSAVGSRRFNEAAARCRGKPFGGAVGELGRACTARFNEAAARCRGKPAVGGGRCTSGDTRRLQ